MAEPISVTLLMPLRDDWLSASQLLRDLDAALVSWPARASILIVDDGSLEPCDHGLFAGPFEALATVNVLNLRRNLGHQRAIAVGLAYVHEHLPCDAVLVMDSDGEDTPAGVMQLLKAFVAADGREIIFAKRTRRSESLLFRTFYLIYRGVHIWLTGIRVRVGNFSIVPFKSLNTLVVMSELWSHYAAAVFRSRMAFTMVPIPRGRRIAGVSRMNFTALVSHGLGAISVFSDIVGVRLLILSLQGSALCVLGVLVVIAIRLFTHLSVPGWATYVTGLLSIILFQLVTIAASFTFFILSNRTTLGFLPFRDYSLFVEGIDEVYPHD